MRFPGDDEHHKFWVHKVKMICDTESRAERIRLLSLFTLANGHKASQRLREMVQAEWSRRRSDNGSQGRG